MRRAWSWFGERVMRRALPPGGERALMRRARSAARLQVGDRGAASVLAIGIVGAVVAVTALVVPAVTTFVASQRAANAADAAALAAADAISGAVAGEGCDLAEQVAARNGADLVSCVPDGPAVTVVVTLPSIGGRVEASARAGPPGWTG
jgi:secretion/DNA translocation related TadE-like protein